MKNGMRLCLVMATVLLMMGCKVGSQNTAHDTKIQEIETAESAVAPGLNFHERVDGFVMKGDHKVPSYFDLDARIEDFDLWSKDPEHKVAISGFFYLENETDKSWIPYTLEGELAVIKKHEGKTGHFLQYNFVATPYRSNASALNLPDIALIFKGYKTVQSEQKAGRSTDAYTLKGEITWGSGEVEKIPAEYSFNIKDPTNVRDFVKSFKVTNVASKKQEFDAIVRFLKVTYQGVAEEFMPHVEKRRQSSI